MSLPDYWEATPLVSEKELLRYYSTPVLFFNGLGYWKERASEHETSVLTCRGEILNGFLEAIDEDSSRLTWQ